MKKVDYNELLSNEMKLLIVQGQTLVSQTHERVTEQFKDVDLICRLQLRDDCKAVERFIKKFKKGRVTDKDMEELNKAVIRLQTSADAILK